MKAAVIRNRVREIIGSARRPNAGPGCGDFVTLARRWPARQSAVSRPVPFCCSARGLALALAFSQSIHDVFALRRRLQRYARSSCYLPFSVSI